MLALEGSRRVEEKLLAEIGVNTDTLSPTQLALGTLYNIKQIWDYELFNFFGRQPRIGPCTSSTVALDWRCLSAG